MNVEIVALGITHRIYEAAGDPSLWPTVLEELTLAVGGAAGTLLFAPQSHAQPAVFTSVGIDPKALASYDAYYVRNDIRLQRALAQRVGATLCHDELEVRDNDFERTEFCADFLRPLGLFYITGSVLLYEPEFLSVLGIHRPSGRGDYTPEALQLMDLVLPHMQQSMRLHSRLSMAEARLAAGERALRGLGVAMVLLDGNGAAVCVNEAARLLLSRRDGLSLVGGTLVAARPDLTRSLGQLIRDAALCDRKVVRPGGSMALPRPSLRRPLAISVCPVAPDLFPLGRRRALVAIFVSDPEERHELPAEALARLYDLTPAETRMAAALAGGQSMEEAAASLGVTRETARTHLKHVFHKTGTGRQVELVALLLRIARQLPTPRDQSASG